MSTAGAMRAKRRAELVSAIGECERVLKGFDVSAYRKAFDAMAKAGGRYDRAEREDSPKRFEDASLWFAEPDDIETAVNEAVSTALERLSELRAHLKGG